MIPRGRNTEETKPAEDTQSTVAGDCFCPCVNRGTSRCGTSVRALPIVPEKCDLAVWVGVKCLRNRDKEGVQMPTVHRLNIGLTRSVVVNFKVFDPSFDGNNLTLPTLYSIGRIGSVNFTSFGTVSIIRSMRDAHSVSKLLP